MAHQDIKTFQECLEIATNANGNKHLLLGNGFSIDLFPTIFNYKVLSDKVKSPQVKRLFAELGTNDFEFVMRKLTDVLFITQLYPEGDALSVKLMQYLEEIKNTLINVISQSHPTNPQAITDEQYDSCHEFLKHFNTGNKFTFNYDLLLYWVYMHFHDDEDKQLKCDDGFRHPVNDQSIVTWEIGREINQSLYYLHGAMHIFNDGSGIEKYTWLNNGKAITDQVRESIDSQKYPVFISEGTKEHKLSRIKDNSYLGRGFSSLKSLGGNLFIFGHSLRDEDDHVFDYINVKSKVSNIFISIFGNLNSEDNHRIFSKVARWKLEHENRQYHYYHSYSANVWGNHSTPNQDSASSIKTLLG